jgi:anti-anti-sigma regulatory factor
LGQIRFGTGTSPAADLVGADLGSDLGQAHLRRPIWQGLIWDRHISGPIARILRFSTATLHLRRQTVEENGVTPFHTSNGSERGSLAQYVAVERHPRGVVARITCPVVGQREAPIIISEIADALSANNFPRNSSLVLDFSSVTVLSSMGLGMLIDLRNRCNTMGMRPVIFGANGQLRDLLRMMKIDRMYALMYGREDLYKAVA